MKLYLFRHGKAFTPAAGQPQSLTLKGREEVSLIAEHFKKNHLKVTDLWHSPKTRAQQTSELFLSQAGFKDVRIEVKEDLKPEGDPQGLFQAFNGLSNRSLMLVTHLPLVGELATLLAPGSPGATRTFPTAGLAAFEKKNGLWNWLWSIDPSKLG